ncbi:GIY-YIG nuclease family protein [Klebsiella pneumoniae]|uniref:GIY-YIG nuclease family protein n=1 Tax=Klebsiella TaxID=570 RepID=UPI000665F9A1|nr:MULTISPECIES: GIY-YIG nuclease family protein [Klebsiella]EKJ7338024.1 GIY-YIG nuclease family protein [Klebsiella pneumoniae]EKX6497787.1 GIY-YIG nuclease family protein [Klebsiella pneumoniae]EKX6682075.1 GIY-YIG nuclease family protein [Klebsiella pneumoniae]EKY1372882.1 GIY-YIG nuclease family protein [Klebsiella pneumoniae]ELA0962045.1 GIY-YIG nuclease family protein [Klebsiella pneumoniae]
MEALYPILIVLGVGAAIGAYITYRYLISKHKKVVEYLELRNQKSLAAEIEEKEEVIEKYKNKDIAREVEHNNLKNELRQIIEINRIKSKEILGKAVDFAFDFETIFREQHHSAQEEIQKVLDDTYRYKRKTLLASVTLRNFEKKLEDIRREKAIYQTLIAKYDFFQLRDHSDWKVVEKEFRDKVLELQAAQDERDAQNEIKRQMREERQRAEELERQQQEAEAKEQELEARRKAVEEALLAADEEHRQELEETRRQLEQEIEDVHKQYERAKSMAQMTKQGHVYIISNIGSFGENVFKIGMTRRLEPLDRVSELSGASVPFEFDVHAMISCDDAPALEYALHNKLSSERMNKVNLRKEFFKTDLNKIIQCVEEHHGKVEYVADPAALQYYRSLEIAEEAQNNKELFVAS